MQQSGRGLARISNGWRSAIFQDCNKKDMVRHCGASAIGDGPMAVPPLGTIMVIRFMAFFRDAGHAAFAKRA